MKPFSLEEYIKNPNWKVVTRDGKNVTIHCTNYNSDYPIIAQIAGSHSSDTFNKEGKFCQTFDTNNDLFFDPEKHEGWINIFKTYDCKFLGQSTIYESEKTAIEEGKNYGNYFTTIKIEWEE